MGERRDYDPSFFQKKDMGKEAEPLKINIYALEETVTTEDRVSKQGFGTSRPLENPVKNIYYRWEGKLFSPNDDGSVGESSNVREDIVALAQNFADNYRNHLDPDKLKKKEATYLFSFEPGTTGKKLAESNRGFGKESRVRDLTQQEQEIFNNAFIADNKEAAQKKK